jgi:hypothetical protein
MSQEPIKLRVARLAAFAGVVGAIIGSTLTGALAYVTTNKTIASNAAQDQIKFLRDQRLAVYSKIVTDNADVANRERALALEMDAAANDDAALHGAYDALARSIDQLRQDSFSVNLLGTKATTEAVRDLLEAHQDFYKSVADQVDAIASQPDGVNFSVGNAASYNEKVVPKLVEGTSAFLAAAQADLGVH